MLQMIQIDENDKKNVGTSISNNDGMDGNNYAKDDNFGKTAENVKRGLPKIKTNMNQTRSYFHTVTNINNLNPEEDNNFKKMNSKEEEQNKQPKITKIYRMNKEN